ncbi:MAG: transporter [Bryobacteraceae bacterium]|jgi:hypothetical protein
MKLRTLQVLIAVFGLAISAAYAKEGSDQYAYGAENWFTGALPPPGTYFLNYAGYYTGQLRDGSGNKVNLGGTTPSVDAVFDALRVVEVTHIKILGASWGMHAIVPLVWQSVDLGGSASKFGVGDIDVDPIVLGWHGENWHAVAALDTILPTGHYDKNDARVSIGTHYVTIQPLLALTFLPVKTWETSAKLMFDANTTNGETNYHSGDEFHFDYVAGKHIGHWSVGVSGYFLEQLANDTVNGQIVAANPGFWDTGRKGQALAAGPSVTYATKSHMEFICQYQREMLVRNRFGGDKFWFKMIIPL